MGEVIIGGHGFSPAQVERAYRKAAEQQMKRAMALVEAEARRHAPFRTGHLRRTITSTVTTHGGSIVGTVGTPTFYGPYLESGTGIYGPRKRLIVPVRARALRFPSGGRASVFAGGRQRQGAAGSGFRLSGQQRAGKAGANAQWAFRRSVRGIRPLHFFADAVETTRGRVRQELSLVPSVAAKLLEAK